MEYKFFKIFSSILNKLTPEKFDKLSLELLNVGIDSQVILKGIILLVRTTNSSISYEGKHQI